VLTGCRGDAAMILQKEEDGIMTIKFKDAISAQACILVSFATIFRPQVDAIAYLERLGTENERPILWRSKSELSNRHSYTSVHR
jgi:hypothetical protein